ncbi:MAG TPA: hypothetical protein DD418_09495 [Pseudomonas sp.]|nr:hypothetical protein [Pseudomonas sp.]
MLADYAAYLRDVVGRGDVAVSAVQNWLSSVNRAMAARQKMAQTRGDSSHHMTLIDVTQV